MAGDAINPKHYKRGSIEAIDVIEAFDLGFHLGNVVKYILRAKEKGRDEDLRKAKWYLDRFVGSKELMEKFNDNADDEEDFCDDDDEEDDWDDEDDDDEGDDDEREKFGVDYLAQDYKDQATA